MPTPSWVDPTDRKALNAAWERHREQIIKAMETTEGAWGEADVLLAIVAGQFDMWIGQHGALLTRYQQYPAFKTLVIMAAGGDTGRALKELLQMERIVTQIARDQHGCAKAEIIGRRGWERVMKDYRLASITLVRDL